MNILLLFQLLCITHRNNKLQSSNLVKKNVLRIQFYFDKNTTEIL